MSQQVIIEEHEMTPAMARCLNKDGAIFSGSARMPSGSASSGSSRRYVAAAGGELFVADTPEEVERLAARSIPTKCSRALYLSRKAEPHLCV